MAGMTARFGPMAVTFEGSLYDGRLPRVIEFAAPMQLGEADLVAAMWLATPNPEDLVDPEFVREFVADTIVNSGLDEVDEARCEIAELVPGTAEYAWSQQIQAAVRRAFASVLADHAALAEVA